MLPCKISLPRDASSAESRFLPRDGRCIVLKAVQLRPGESRPQNESGNTGKGKWRCNDLNLKTVAPQHLFSVKLKEWYSYIKIEKFHLNALHEAINHEKQRFLPKEYGERRGGKPFRKEGRTSIHGLQPCSEFCEANSPDTRMSGLFRRYAPYKGLHPLRRFAAILAHLGNKHGSDEPHLFPKSLYPNLISKEDHFYVPTKLRA